MTTYNSLCKNWCTYGNIHLEISIKHNFDFMAHNILQNNFKFFFESNSNFTKHVFKQNFISYKTLIVAKISPNEYILEVCVSVPLILISCYPRVKLTNGHKQNDYICTLSIGVQGSPCKIANVRWLAMHLTCVYKIPCKTIA